MRLIRWGVAAALLCATSAAQQVNGPFHALAVNQPTSNVLFQANTTAAVFTDSTITVNMKGQASTPVILLWGTLQLNALNMLNFKVDLANQGSSYANQQLMNGYTNPSPATWTNAAGDLAYLAQLPACVISGTGALTCISQSTFSQAVQAVVQDPTNAPFNVSTTGACNMTFTNGYTNFALGSFGADLSVTYNFLGGFTFNFYGTTYTQCFVSANGFVSFGGQDTGFPQPSVGVCRSGVRRIMAFFNDLEPNSTPASYNPRIFAQMSIENGVRRVKIGHERLAEFANATGPHGGEITMFENGDVIVFVPGYNVAPSISTAIGITPGNNLDTGTPPAVGQTAFGRDLSADFSAAAGGAPVFLGTNRAGFELFDYTNIPVNNVFDLSGLGFNPANPEESGIKFLRDPGVTGAGQAQYIISN